MSGFLPNPGRVSRPKDLFVRLLLYAEIGLGKSYFADRFPEPFVINTDGNLPFYTAPGVVVNNWEATTRPVGLTDDEWADLQRRSVVNVIDELVATNGGGFKTIIVDLVDGIYELARTAKLEEFGLKHESDAGGYGKGYQIVRDPFYAAIKKLYSLPLNVILLSHEDARDMKDRIGRTYVRYSPKLSDAVLDKLSGTGYTLRAYWKGSLTEDNMASKAKRMLSLSPKDDELHVARLVDADGNAVELEDIELDYDIFVNTMKALNDPEKVGSFKTAPLATGKPETPKKSVTKKTVTKTTVKKPEPKVEEPKVEEPKVEEPKVEEVKVEEPKVEEVKVEEPKVTKTTKKTTPASTTAPLETKPKKVSTISPERRAALEALKAKYKK